MCTSISAVCTNANTMLVCRRNYMFWTVVSPASIRRARLDGTDMQVLVTTELTSPGNGV